MASPHHWHLPTGQVPDVNFSHVGCILLPEKPPYLVKKYLDIRVRIKNCMKMILNENIN